MIPDLLQKLLPAPLSIEALSSEAMVSNMIKIECIYLEIMGGDARPYEDFKPCMDLLKKAVASDGLVVPDLVRQMRAHHDDELLHKGMTSQDVIDTALMLAIANINSAFMEMLCDVQEKIESLIDQYGAVPMMARTRMQAALEVTSAHRLQIWLNGFQQIAQDLQALRPTLERVSLGGPVGDGRHWKNSEEIADKLAQKLELSPQPFVWHAIRQNIQDYGNWLAKLTGHGGKFGQDIALMAQQGIDEIKLSKGGTSSAMAHKSNPVQAEVLVSLGHHNAGLLGVLAQTLIHEQERSGAAWTLEWLTLPSMIQNAEASLRGTKTLLTNIEYIGT